MDGSVDGDSTGGFRGYRDTAQVGMVSSASTPPPGTRGTGPIHGQASTARPSAEPVPAPRTAPQHPQPAPDAMRSV